MPTRRPNRERVYCPDCGRAYLRPLGVARPHGDRCTGVPAQLAAVREALAIRRADLTLLLWWAKRKASR